MDPTSHCCFFPCENPSTLLLLLASFSSLPLATIISSLSHHLVVPPGHYGARSGRGGEKDEDSDIEAKAVGSCRIVPHSLPSLGRRLHLAASAIPHSSPSPVHLCPSNPPCYGRCLARNLKPLVHRNFNSPYTLSRTLVVVFLHAVLDATCWINAKLICPWGLRCLAV